MKEVRASIIQRHTGGRHYKTEGLSCFGKYSGPCHSGGFREPAERRILAFPWLSQIHGYCAHVNTAICRSAALPSRPSRYRLCQAVLLLFSLILLTASRVPAQKSESRAPESSSLAAADAIYQKAMLLLRERNYGEALDQFRLLEKQSPRSPQGPSGEGIALALMGRPQEAIAALQKALAINPNYWVAHRELGIVFWSQGLKRQAVRELQPLIHFHPDDGPVAAILGQYEFEQKNYSLALNYLARAPAETVADPKLALIQAEAELKTGHRPEAAATLNNLEGRTGLTLQERFALAWSLGQAKLFKAATREFQALPSNYPDPYRRNYGLALAYFGERSYGNCILTLKAMLAGGSKSPDVFSLLGVAEEKSGDTKAAYGAFRQGIVANPEDAQNYLNIATLSCEHLNCGLADQILSEGIERIPQSHELFLSRGIARTLEAEFSQAQQDYQRAIQLAPTDPAGYLAMGLSELEAGQLSKAIESFKKAAARGPKDPQPYYFLTESLIQEGAPPGSAAFRQAMQAINRALALDPGFAYARRDRAELELAAGETDEAIADLERARVVDPKSLSIAYVLAQAYSRKGKKAQARALFGQINDVRSQEDRAFVRRSLTRALVVIAKGKH